MLWMRGIRKAYRTRHVRTLALDGLSLHVRRGKYVSVVGPSGAGKTTFLNVAGLLDTFDEGECRLDGIDVHTLSDPQAAGLRNRMIGFIFQAFNLVPDLDVLDNVELPLQYTGMPAPERRRRAEAALERVGVIARRRYTPSQLSGGQQQRVAIARAIVNEPALILADEPTGNLDSVTAREIVALLEGLHGQGATLVVATHHPGLVARAGRTLHIVDGRAVDAPLPAFVA